METTDADPRYERLRSVLIATRKRQELTQDELGQKLGKDQTWVSKIEAGVRQVDVVEFLQIAQALGVNSCRMLKKIAE
jgi:transcriptional regulator with XRE-family HTH domain